MSSNSHEKIWNEALVILEKEIPAPGYKFWILSLKPLALNYDTFVLFSKTKTECNQTEKLYKDQIKKALQQVTSVSLHVEFCVLDDVIYKKYAPTHFDMNPKIETSNNFNLNQHETYTSDSNLSTPISTNSINNPTYSTMAQNNMYQNLSQPSRSLFQQELKPNNTNVSDDSIVEKGFEDIPLYPENTFDKFIIGESNAFAVSVCKSLASDLSQRSFNPLFIYGDSGLGKTHLMQAIGNYVIQNYPNKRVVYTTTEKFMNWFIECIKSNHYTDFREKYRNADLLLIDDIQFIEKKTQMQVEFFHTFEAICQHTGNIVMTSDRAPSHFNNLEDRLKTRFSSGILVDIKPPEFETRLAILQKFCENRKIYIDSEILQAIAFEITGSIRELQGAFNKICAVVSLGQNQNLTPEIAISYIQRSQDTNVNRNLDKKSIVNVVCNFYNITNSEIFSNSKAQPLSLARQVAMYFCCELLNLTQADVAKYFNKDNHTTVGHACKKVRKLKKDDPNFAQNLEDLKKRLLV